MVAHHELCVLKELVRPIHLPIWIERIIHLELIMRAGIAFIGKIRWSRLDNAEFSIFGNTDSFWGVVPVFVGLQACRSPQSIDGLRRHIK